MHVLSVNIAVPIVVKWRGKDVTTGIDKRPVTHRVRIGTLAVEGDTVADTRVHGGPDKALYAYAAEHYASWKDELEGTEIPWGMFGENLTIDGGLFEDRICIGDRFAIGTAEVMAVQPRMPCYKLGIRFGTQHFVKRFAESGRFGVYFRVLAEGTAGAGDRVERISAMKDGVSIREIGRLLLGDSGDRDLLRRAAALEDLPEALRRHFASQLEHME